MKVNYWVMKALRREYFWRLVFNWLEEWKQNEKATDSRNGSSDASHYG
jgi:hypothetical protein